jgi:hypothetical protein
MYWSRSPRTGMPAPFVSFLAGYENSGGLLVAGRPADRQRFATDARSLLKFWASNSTPQ